MSWNPVLNLFCEIKEHVIEYGHSADMWDYEGDCVNHWVNVLEKHGHDAETYRRMITPLKINEFDGMILVKYNDLLVDFDAYDGFYRECRSVVIDIHNDCLVLTPFRKFFNIGEKPETQMEIVGAKVGAARNVFITNKLDGSMVSARWYNDRLVVSGSQALNIENSFRLKNYYDWFAHTPAAIEMLKHFPNTTFIFEGIFKNDPHIVKYDYEGCVLIGARNVWNGYEWRFDDIDHCANLFGVDVTVHYPDMGFYDMLDNVKFSHLRADEAEGFVICVDNQKYKCKFKEYVNMHRVINKYVSPNAVLDVMRNGTYDDFYSNVPEPYKVQVSNMHDDIVEYVLDRTTNTLKYYQKMMLAVEGESIKIKMVWITNNVPVAYQHGVRNIVLNKETDWLKGRKYNDILIAIGKEPR